MDRIPYHDVQGIIIRGYKELTYARFVLISFQEPAAARAWLGRLPITAASLRRPDEATQIALTAQGLTELGLGSAALDLFAPEFREGMAGTAHRQRLLGDTGSSEPSLWAWGGPNTAPVHAIVLLYADSPDALDRLEAHRCGASPEDRAKSGIRVEHRLPTQTLRDGERYWFREHFGFRDGVAQPSLDVDNPGDDQVGGGISKPTNDGNTIRLGEFLFGYPTEYGKVPYGGGSDKLALNGSFLVFRQLEQKVVEFWTFIRQKAREAHLDPILLATKMVGRWPSGAPLVHAPHEDTAGLETFDAFGYEATDPKGLVCPFSSHIRRANPRDTLVDDPAESVKLSKTHRLVRRGRPYGVPIFDPLEPARFLPALDTISAAPPAGGRGLHFLCFNTSIRRQFEFVQQTWLNNPKFARQHASPDPIAGQFDGKAEFMLPGHPAQTRVGGIEPFVVARGGAYFFMPGIKALHELASL
jgi:Dyp-type peroxidase family